MKAEDIRAAMKRTFTPPSQEVVFEVPDDVSGTARRFCDAMVFDLWASRGFEVAGYEIKISRGDWMREVKMPQKAEIHFNLCDRWWLITPAPDGDTAAVAKREDIPGPWGWAGVTKKGDITVLKPAPKLAPKKREWRFALAILRAANKSDAKEIQVRVDKMVAAHSENMTARINARAQELVAGSTRQADKRFDLVGKLEDAIGEAWNYLGHDDVVAAVKAVYAVRKTAAYHNFGNTADKLSKIAEALKGADAAIQALQSKDGAPPAELFARKKRR